MRTVLFTAHKGGCGKSILAACLAVAAKETGERVVVLDLDPKGSVLRWGARRNDRALRARAVAPIRLRKFLASLARGKTSLVIVDTPSLESPISLAAIEAAQLAIVPARPAVFDLWASATTGRKLRLMDKDFVYMLNQCPPVRKAAIVQEAIVVLESTGPLLRPHIHARGDFLEAARTGKGVTEINAKGRAAKEMRALWRAVAARLPRSQKYG